MTCVATACRPATLLTLFAWLFAPTVPAARRLDRRIGLLVPNGAAAQSQAYVFSSTTTPLSGKFGVVSPSARGGPRLNADELVKLGVDADEVQRHVRRLEEDDTQTRQQLQPSQPRTRQQHPVTSWPSVSSPSSASGAFQQMFHRAVPKNAEQVRSEHHLMRRYFIRNNRTAACNDGSRAGFYIRRALGASRRWIIFLDGGWMCFDQISCQSRWINSPHLMSSEKWPFLRAGSGILSMDPEENPFIHDGNMVYVPYCSSDAWSGTYKAKSSGEFSFLGAVILNEVVTELVATHGLASATDVYLTGSSAGATGVMLNIDRISRLLGSLAPYVRLRGIVDSGWFLDNHPYRHHPCTDAFLCSPSELVQRGVQLWQGQTPDECRSRHTAQPWKCYFGYHLYSSLHTVVFIVQYLFDEAQIMADNVGPPVHGDQWQYIYRLGLHMKQSLANVSAVFAPACLSHILLTRREWNRLDVNGVTLSSALNCWESGLEESNHYGVLWEQPERRVTKPLNPSYDWNLVRPLSKERRRQNARKADRLQADEAVLWSSDRGRMNRKILRRRNGNRKLTNVTTSRIRHQRHLRVAHRREQDPLGSAEGHSDTDTVSFSTRQTPTAAASTDRDAATTSTPMSDRRRRRAVFVDDHDLHRLRHHGPSADGQNPGCSHRLVDRCSWPQCNTGCPNVRNPFTGNEMSVTELFRAARIDPSSADFGAASKTGESSAASQAAAGADDEMGERLMSLLLESTRR